MDTKDAARTTTATREVLARRQTEIWNTVRTSVAELLNVDPAGLSPQTVLLRLGAQSLDFVDLTLRLERVFKIPLPRTLAISEEQTLQSYVLAVASALADEAATSSPPR